MDQRGDARHEQAHGDRERIDQQRRGHVQRTDVDPVEEVDRHLALAVVQQQHEGDHRGHEAEPHDAGRDVADLGLVHTLAVEQHRRKAEQRQQQDQRGEVRHLSPSTPTARRPT